MRWSDSRKAPTELARGTGADQGSALRQEGPTHGHGGPRWAWWALGLVYLAVVGACLTVQPLGVPPDEIAHIQYAEFIASQGGCPSGAPRMAERPAMSPNIPRCSTWWPRGSTV